MKVAIVGAGIGGLTTALCLSESAHDITVFERSSRFDDIGAGIQCGANAVTVLQSLGLMPELDNVAVRPERVEFRDFRSGMNLHTMPLGRDYEQNYGAPYFHLHRSDLHGVLLAAIKGKKNISLKMASSVTSYKEFENEVVLNLESGQTFKADLLIGADGIRSQIKAHLLGNIAPNFTGNVAWRGVVDASKLPDDWMDTVVSNFVGPRKHMVLYYLRNKRLANFVGVVENSEWRHGDWSAKATWEQLQNDFADWHPIVEQIISAVDKNSCYRWALFDHKPLKNWSSNRVTLLGDAAHATLPFMASGAAMAIEDARILQRSLDQEQRVSRALQLYQRNRFERTAKIQTNSARAAKLYHFKNSFTRKAAFTGFKLISAQQESFLPNYDANTVTLI